MRRLVILGAAMALTLAVLSPASAGTLTADAPLRVSGESPFGDDCGREAAGGTLFLDSEVEPYVDVNPVDDSNIVAIWQQDRWSNGGARGNVAGVSFDGGLSWQLVLFGGVSECDGGEFDRASDPWVSFGPDGTLYAMHLVTDAAPPAKKPGGFGRNGMMVQASRDGGITWEDPILIAEETDGDGLHDKNTLTADPTREGYAYAVWDFLDIPPGGTINPERGTFGGGLGFKGGSLISRTTDGGMTWSQPQRLYNPGGVNQTIGNQIVVQPNGRLVNVFNEILNFRNDDVDAQFDFNLALKYSDDAGETWLPQGRPIRFGDMIPRGLFTPTPGVYQPDAVGAATLDPANAVRTADAIPEVAVGPEGNLYVVWQDARFSFPGASDVTQIYDGVAFSMSTDGGFTWSTPIKVNQTPDTGPLGNRQAFIPMVRAL
ncbi:MAG: glycoside hydrolase, partial [Acidimicrobiia bacterium]|nr:glycoside hydrolase [Acidimicrobiia bacterium]